jgi:hypothetical protein
LQYDYKAIIFEQPQNSEEQECYDNLPESLQYAERGERMSEIVDTLNDAANDMESITENLRETQE